MNTDERLIYNKESVQKSLELLNESNNEFRDAGVELRTAMDMLNEIKGNDLLKNIENLTNENTPKMLMTMCDENIGNTIYNINNGVEKVENYLTTGEEIDLRSQSEQRTPLGQQPTAPTQPTAPNEQFREQPPSPPEQPSPPSGQPEAPQNNEQPTTGPNGEQPPSPPEQPSPPDGQQNSKTTITGPNGEQPPSPPEQPSSPTETPTIPQPAQEDMKKGSLVGALIGLGIGATATGGTTAAVLHYKKKKKNEEENMENNENNNFFKDL